MIPSWEGGVRTGPYVRRGQPNVASLSVLGLSSDDAKKLTSSAELTDAAAHIEAAKSSVMNSI
jgi:hypothetical protein